MTSVIICSPDRAKLAASHAMYQTALGNEPWELIGVTDAKSLAEGYNRAVAASRGEIVIFSHDDVEVLNPDFAGRLHRHLARFDLIGVAGTSRLINGQWISAATPYVFGQICHQHPRGELVVDIYGAPRAVVGNIQALDGLFMAARRAVVEKVSFDSVTFDGFHLYDLDFSFGAYQAGFKLAVANDINLLHQSGGEFNQVWREYSGRFMRKWKDRLPPSRPTVFQSAGVTVPSKAAALEVMTPFFWQEK